MEDGSALFGVEVVEELHRWALVKGYLVITRHSEKPEPIECMLEVS